MTATTMTTIKPPSDFLAAAALPGKTKRNRKQLRTLLRDLDRANKPRSTEDFVERVNDRTDAGLQLKITTIGEAALLAELVLVSDGEDLPAPVRAALESIGRVLAATITSGAH